MGNFIDINGANGGSGQAILLIFNGYRSKNRCFQALYHPFRPQNGHHRVLMALGADSIPRFFLTFLPLTRPPSMNFTLSTKPLLPTPVKSGTAFNGAGGNATAPFVFTNLLSVSQILLYPLPVIRLHEIIGLQPK